MSSVRTANLLDAVTASATGSPVDISNAEKVSFQFTRANHAAGSSLFTIEGSVDGTNYVTLNMLVDNVANAIAEGLTRVASVTLNANSSKVYALDLENFVYKYIRGKVVETTDGTHTITVLIQDC